MTIEEAIQHLLYWKDFEDATKEAFDLLCKEARLGALVREMPIDMDLAHHDCNTDDPWIVNHYVFPDGKCEELTYFGDTPEAALLAAKEKQE